MKKKITSSGMKSIFTIVILMSGLFINVAKAAEDKPAKSANYGFKYVGQLKDQPIFQLDIENLQKEDVFLKLEDEVGNVLYNDKFSEVNFSKKFQFDISEHGSTTIKMILFSRTLKQTQVFKIENVRQLVESVVVTKVD
ncbi:hypothetical protein [Segetibacter sp.]|jgi:hypothetical protein|uniref:hypothetical protein n=1 Tax=Segetibacter sp. TaxID=2231182 RepID=UPI002628D42F|nr:hypothetical protein [Segetibacter sp.]MCW3078705.1 hypothetical protein [Segetibacter sp.]